MILDPSVKRLLWKDYCEYRGLWWAMLIGSLIFFWGIAGFEVSQRSQNTLPLPVVELASLLWFVVAVCFPAAVGATSFSREHEQETYVFLRSLPIRSRSVLLCRCGLVAFATILLFVLFFGIAIATSALSVHLTVEHANLPETFGMLSLSMMVAIEAFLIGVFFSMLTKHPLGALLMTGLAMMLIHGTVLSGTSFEGFRWLIWQGIVGVAAIAFGILDFIAVPQWFREGNALDLSAPISVSGKRARENSRSMRESSKNRNTAKGTIRVLLWQQWRQLGLWYVLAVAAGLLVLLLPGGVIATFVLLVLTGSSIFYHEKQNGRYRFLSQRGIHPFKVWLARNSILFPVIAIACGLTAWVIYHQAPGIIGRHCLYAFAPLIAFVVVQFCILVTDQYIVGLVLAFLLAALAIGWCLLAAMLSLPFGIGFVPLMLGALIAGYKRLADLLNERSLAISKCVPWSILVGSMLVTVTATATYRVYSIPATNGAELRLVSQIEKASEATDAQTEVFQRFESAAREITTWGNKLDGRFYFEGPQVVENPDAIEDGEWGDSDGDSVLDQYQANFDPSPIRGDWTHSWANIKTISPEEESWLEENRSQLSAIVAAIQDLDFEPSGGESGNAFSWHLDNFNSKATRLLVCGARAKTNAGDLAGALTEYKLAFELVDTSRPIHSVHDWIQVSYLEQMVLENLVGWAGHSDQTKDSLVEVMEWLVASNEEPPNPAGALANDYSRYRNVFFEIEQLEQVLSADDMERTAFLYRLLPWERTRSRRLYDYINVQQQEWVNAEIRKLREIGPEAVSDDSPLIQNQQALWNTAATHWLASQDDSLVKLAMELENRRRAIIWQLRLIAHRIDNGEYPGLLDQVDKLVEFRDTDLFMGLPFIYRKNEAEPVPVNEPLGTYWIVSDGPQLVSSNQTWSGGRWIARRFWLP